jgi:hypothetical protein
MRRLLVAIVFLAAAAILHSTGHIEPSWVMMVAASMALLYAADN